VSGVSPKGDELKQAEVQMADCEIEIMNGRDDTLRSGLKGGLLLAWRTALTPVLAVLITLEPVVRFVLSAVALLLLLTALFFRAIGTPHFPFWGMIGFSVGCTVLVMAYVAAIRAFNVSP
jgi:hypothetical protein